MKNIIIICLLSTINLYPAVSCYVSLVKKDNIRIECAEQTNIKKGYSVIMGEFPIINAEGEIKIIKEGVVIAIVKRGKFSKGDKVLIVDENELVVYNKNYKKYLKQKELVHQKELKRIEEQTNVGTLLIQSEPEHYILSSDDGNEICNLSNNEPVSNLKVTSYQIICQGLKYEREAILINIERQKLLKISDWRPKLIFTDSPPEKPDLLDEYKSAYDGKEYSFNSDKFWLSITLGLIGGAVIGGITGGVKYDSTKNNKSEARKLGWKVGLYSLCGICLVINIFSDEFRWFSVYNKEKKVKIPRNILINKKHSAEYSVSKEHYKEEKEEFEELNRNRGPSTAKIIYSDIIEKTTEEPKKDDSEIERLKKELENLKGQ